jgi:two-component system sensor histidine kinase RegB
VRHIVAALRYRAVADYNAAMLPAADSNLLSTLPARALLGRLLAVRISLIAGWVAGIAWLHWGISIPMPLLPMGAVLALMGLFSLSTAWRLRLDIPATQMEFLAHLLADLTAFAVLVFFSGGVTNPFVSLMLVPIVIAAISLRPRWVWLLAAVAGGLYALLLFFYQPLAVANPVAAYGMHLGGMWLNFLISAGLIAFFVTRMHAALRARDQELSALREKQLRDERIVALGTQAALAAHELATPLATIQTTAHELASEFANDPDIGADCQLLEKQALACKRILTQLAARAQDTPPTTLPLDVWLSALIERWQVLRPDAQITPTLPPDQRDFTPPDGLEQAILNVLNNAADAAPEPVEFCAAAEQDALVIDIADRGQGFTPEQKAQAGRVLFSGKPGQGWGMGLALTHATLERLGGSLTLTEREGGGTRMRITLPWSHAA